MNDRFQQQIADALDDAAGRKRETGKEIPVSEARAELANYDDLLMTVPEAAEYLRCSKSMVYKLVEADRIPAYRIGRLLRIRKSDLEASLRGFAIA